LIVVGPKLFAFKSHCNIKRGVSKCQRVINIDCRDKDWKSRLKLGLQADKAVSLVHFDYTVDGQFCEMLALAHNYGFRLDAPGETGHFKKKRKPDR